MNDLKLYVAIVSALLCSSCGPKPEELLLGSWQVDSVYSYYNGFDFWQYEQGPDWATYEYTSDGKMKEIKFGTFRPYRYRLSGDTLFWIAGSEPQAGWFQILELRADFMVLKREKSPIFSGEAQERYEIRFFSRVASEGEADTFRQVQNQ